MDSTTSPQLTQHRFVEKTCERDNCSKQATGGKDYCSRSCWQADNPHRL